MKIAIGLLLAITSSLGAQVTDRQLQQQPGVDWLHYNGSYDSRRNSELQQINTSTINALSAQWIFHIPHPTRPEAVPIVANGVMYVTQPNEVYAVDGSSGRMIWEFHHTPRLLKNGRQNRGDASNHPNRGVAIFGDKVYFTTADDIVIALNASTGTIVWQSDIADVNDGYWSPAAPLIVRGKVIVGVAPGDWGLNGYLKAYDAESGKLLWRWDAIPKPGEPGAETWSGDSWKAAGGNTWLTGSYDSQLNLLYWAIGNPSPDFNGDVRKGDNLYTDSVVALDPETGKMKWYFQFTPHDEMDWDGAEIPVLLDADLNGKPRKLMVQADRNGFYYVLDRATGQFIQGSSFVHQLNWASGLSAEGKPIRVPGLEPSIKGTKICPSSIGATNWMSPAYNPHTRLFYVVALEGCGTASKSAEEFRPGGFQYRATGDVSLQDASWKVYVRAINSTTGKLLWEQERVGSTGLGGGLLSTAGGLIFSGELNGQFVALDAASGRPLWHFNTGQQINAQPMTYAVNGKQFVALTAGGEVMSFALHQAERAAAK